MPRRVYSEINLHIVWHTKNNMPMINEKVEPHLYGLLKQKILETGETFFHSVGGTADHVHIAVSIPTTLEIAEWVGKLKGASSYQINKIAGRKALEWQHGFGVVSFGTGDLKWVTEYINNQREHHKKGRIINRLERIECPE